MGNSKKLKAGMLLFIIVLTGCLMAGFIFLLLVSPGKLKQFTDENDILLSGSISEKLFLDIGGVKQGMFIRGRNVKNPVLLFAHGGPSFPEYFLVDKYPTGLEDHFTVCYWEERGGGLSYTPEVTSGSMTLEQLTSDAIEVACYLRARFNKEKIYLMAHSGGTAFAIQAAAGSPELFHAYIGVSQVTRQSESEKLAYKYMTDHYSSHGNSKALARLAEYPILRHDSLVLPFFNSVLRDKSMHELGIGTMRDMKSVVKGVFYPVWTCRAYTLKEKFNLWYSKFAFISKTDLRKQVINTDIPSKVPGLDIPAYFLSGKYDLTVNCSLSREYLNNLEAPVKGFYTFDNSSHSPMFEEPEKFLQIMTSDVLNHVTNLSDR